MRDGLSLTDQAIAYGGGQLTEAVVRAMLGSVDRSHAQALVLALAQRDGATMLAAVDGLRSLGLSAPGTLEEMALLLQQMAVEQAVPGALDADDPDSADARALAAVLAPDETQLLYSMVLHGRAELGLMSDEYGALTMVLLRFLAFPAAGAAPALRAAAAPPATAPERVREPARESRAAPLRTPAPPAITLPAAPAVQAQRAVKPAAASPPWDTPAAEPPPLAAEPAATPVLAKPSAPVPASDSEMGNRWYALVKPLCEQGQLAALARELALQAGLRAIDDTANPPRWHLTVERETLRTAVLRDKLTAVLASALGHALELEVEAGTPDDSPARRDAAARLRRQADAEAAIQGDPVVRELLAQFKTARIVPGSIKPVAN
jgi:DNA polymerase-3 subunit gamma/tau